MEPEIELERFAALCAEVEAGTPLEQLLRTEGLSDDAWARSRDTWMGRMSSEPDAERKLLEARYKSSFDARRRVIEAAAKGAGGEAAGVDDAPTPPRGQPMAIGLMDTVPMLPSADPEQLLARLRARRAAAAGQAGGGGSASEPPQAMPARGESTPPMRPRSALVPDDAMQAASDAMSQHRTTPPTPAGSGKPALPFQTPAKLPPPPPPPPRAAASRPASPASPPRPPPLPSAASSFPTTNPSAAGGYPPVPPPASSSPGGSGPGASPGPGAIPQSTQSAPMSLAGFSSTSSGPRLTLERYAAFAAEIAVHPAQLSDIRSKYGLNDSGHTAESEAWQRRFSADRETYVRYATLFQHYRDWFSTRGPR